MKNVENQEQPLVKQNYLIARQLFGFKGAHSYEPCLIILTDIGFKFILKINDNPTELNVDYSTISDIKIKKSPRSVVEFGTKTTGKALYNLLLTLYPINRPTAVPVPFTPYGIISMNKDKIIKTHYYTKAKTSFTWETTIYYHDCEDKRIIIDTPDNPFAQLSLVQDKLYFQLQNTTSSA